MVHIRKAEETDRNHVAFCIAEGFEKDFSILCKDNQKVADAIAAGLHMERFYVADIKGNIAGVLAISDCNGRAAGVEKEYRRQGIAAAMLRESMQLTNYQEFVLDVTDINNNAIKCYTSIGFEEFRRIPEKRGKQKGFQERIFMRYCRR